ncbi:hypothetical protein HYDPIDRAFT_114156 [Hydnomerulius pinastri MD-312]|uniref:Unplaced genomic scaffold scaffold_19, whole genome shotgun sequence n=1 Tax=Hydnomerulius pinastri MD-312 TaxID=994086 RepID=A0A0C9VXL6_9AGAM|nr:hypothetical protein HYDPIDRAFT_114156 [Hydnomerulius pinastri MD-312]
MSARQAFTPQRPQSCVGAAPASNTPGNISTPNSLNTNASMGLGLGMDFCRPRGSFDMDSREAPGTGGKARSLAGLLGRKKGATSPSVEENRQVQGDLHRRSFEGIRRPERTPLSIIPYPTPQTNAHMGGHLQASAQSPQKAVGQGAYSFPRPSTPVSAPRGYRKGLVGYEGRQDEGEGHGDGIVFMGSGGKTESRVDAGAAVSGYMRVFSRSGSGGTVVRPGTGGQQGLGLKIATPIPGYAHSGLTMNVDDQSHGEGEADGMYAGPLGHLEGIPEEACVELEHPLRRVKRGLGREDMEGEDTRSADGGRQGQKRLRHAQDEDEEYTRLSSPQMPPTPGPSLALDNGTDRSLALGSLFENFGEFISEEEFEAECKRWTECSREEWLKGADELLEDYSGILNLIKDHLTDKVVSFSNLSKTVAEKRADLDRGSETLQDGMGVVTENIAKLASRK